jgi:rubredoxin
MIHEIQPGKQPTNRPVVFQSCPTCNTETQQYKDGPPQLDDEGAFQTWECAVCHFRHKVHRGDEVE